MEKFKILIISVGSLLGQNILDALEGRRDKVEIIGINTIAENPRVFRCDRLYKAVNSNSLEFESIFLDILTKESPNLVLPGRDEDVLILAKFFMKHKEFKNMIPNGSISAIEVMNDKALSLGFAKKFNLPFAESFIVGDSQGDAFEWSKEVGYPIIAKPRDGFGSLGIRILMNDKQLSAFLKSDTKNIILQKLIGFNASNMNQLEKFESDIKCGIPFFFHLPDDAQYASQVLIHEDGHFDDIFTSKSLMVLGRCEKAEPYNHPELYRISKEYANAISSIGWRGMFNLQLRESNNTFFGIEMNGRMSGSTSARAWLGFDEIRLLILSYYNFDIGKDYRYPTESNGFVYRSLTDYYISNKDCQTFNHDKTWSRYESNISIKRICVTGSTGYIGYNLVNKLLKLDYIVDILTTDLEKAQSTFEVGVNNIYSFKDFYNNSIPWGDIDCLIHLGFARPYMGDEQITRSLEFTSELFSKATQSRVKSIINMSSRSVYGNFADPIWKETASLNPKTYYGQAKVSSELFLKSMQIMNPNMHTCSIRLGTVLGASKGHVDVFVLSKFIKQALNNETIRIIGGQQEFDLIDINDVSDALIKLLEFQINKWKDCYNLSSKRTYTIIEFAEMAIESVKRVKGYSNSQIKIENDDVKLRYKLDSSNIYHDLDWEPHVTINQTIDSLVEFYVNEN
jgi:nucleoside-diphosphate-sugar epimerase